MDLTKGLPDLPEGLVEPGPVVGMWVFVALAGLATVALAAIVMLVIRWRKSRGMGRRSAGGPPPRREAEEALRGLQRAAAGMSAAELAVKLSAVVRHYVDRVWGTELGQQTLEEHWVDAGTGLGALNERGGERLARFLADCDGLKFQPTELPAREREDLVKRAGDLIARLPGKGETPRRETETTIAG